MVQLSHFEPACTEVPFKGIFIRACTGTKKNRVRDLEIPNYVARLNTENRGMSGSTIQCCGQ